mgnify:CR=1 FL=1
MHLGGLVMGLTNCILGHYLELCSNKNTDLVYGIYDVRGVNNLKQLMPTKADLNGRDLSKFQIVNSGEFVFNHRTSRNGSKFSIAYNDSANSIICTEDYVVFKIRDDCKKILNARWLYMFFNRPEFDRYVITNSWGSSTEFYDWEDIKSIEIEVPSFSIQQKYVDVYNAMLANQKMYECGLDDLKLVCDAYIEDLRRKVPCEAIGSFIEERNEKNMDNAITLFQGVNVDHVFTEPKRVAEDSENGSVVRTGQFAFNKVMKAHNTKLPIALREGPDCVVSNSYQVFEVTNTSKLLPKYLLLWLNREETQRYAGFISFGTTRDIFTFEDMKEISIPLPDIKIQQSVVNIFLCYQSRYNINEKLKSQIKDICPILIKGSIEEARKRGGIING